MSNRPPFFTPVRIKQAFQLLGAFALLIALTYAFHLSQTHHKYVDTSGEVVFASDQGSPGKSHIFLMKADGSGLKQLTTGNENDTMPAFSPDGSSIAFISDRSGSDQVFVMDAKAEQINQISDGNDSKSNPEFTPDGGSVTFLSRGQIVSTDIISLGSQLLFPPVNVPSNSDSNSGQSTDEKVPVSTFAWSSEKSDQGYALAAVQEDPDTQLQIVTLIPADPTLKPIPLLTAQNVSITWSKDGTKLFVAAIGIAQFDLSKHEYVVQQVSGIATYNLDGTPAYPQLIAQIQTSKSGPENPNVTPDTSHIAFQIESATKYGTFVNEGLGLTTAQPGGQVQLAARGDVHDLQFGPTGKNAIFQSASPTAPGKTDIVVINMSSGTATDITKGAGIVSSAQWSPALPKS